MECFHLQFSLISFLISRFQTLFLSFKVNGLGLGVLDSSELYFSYVNFEQSMWVNAALLISGQLPWVLFHPGSLAQLLEL